MDKENEKNNESNKDHNPPKYTTPIRPLYVPKASFPQSLDAPFPFSKKGAKFEDIIEVLKHVKINLPLLNAIK